MHYFEFELSYIDKLNNGLQEFDSCYFLNLKDVTHLVKYQKQLSDSIYQEAIEGNFSHNQMTPLNYLTQSSSLINDKVYQLFLQNQKVLLPL